MPRDSWISVEERLPDEGRWVWCAIESGIVLPAFVGGLPFGGQVTHWMYAPAAPQVHDAEVSPSAAEQREPAAILARLGYDYDSTYGAGEDEGVAIATVTASVQKGIDVTFHVDDGKLVLDRCEGVEPEAIGAIFPQWMIEAMLKDSKK
jgi:hypothetical protein